MNNDMYDNWLKREQEKNNPQPKLTQADLDLMKLQAEYNAKAQARANPGVVRTLKKIFLGSRSNQ